ncbi:hypothetical protein J7J18_05915 [bacterium]|nr:hypothetical protein [bacterium]
MKSITIPRKEYRELLRLREKLDKILKETLIKERKPMRGRDLLNLAKLKIKGGPRDLSEKTDLYFYTRQD